MMITVDDVRDKLLTLQQAETILATTEPMAAVPFTIGPAIRFSARQGWNHGIKAMDPGEPVSVFVNLADGREGTAYQLTKQTVQELGLTIGLRREYVDICPAELLVPQLNYWFREGLASQVRKTLDYQFLTGDGIAFAFTKQNIRPFSNLGLLREAVAGIKARYNTDDIWVDARMSHTLRQTTVRLILPTVDFVVDRTGTPDDRWSLGVSIRNSLTGTSGTSMDGYLFRWVCTNGQTDSAAKTGAFTRRKDAADDEVYAWARQSVDDIFISLEGAMDQLANLTSMPVEGRLSDMLRDIFEHYRISIQHRTRIIAILEQYDGDITMYVIMNAITQVATEAGLDASTIDSLMKVGGDLPYTANERCGASNPCGRLVHSH